MKNTLIIIFTLLCFGATAQKAGIFYYAIQLDEDLITFRQRVDNNRQVVTQTTDRMMVSEQLVDSIRMHTQELLAEHLGKEVILIEKKGNAAFSPALPSGMVEGLPFQGLRKGQKLAPELEQYVKIFVAFREKAKLSVSSRSSETDTRYTERWLIKPQVKVQLKLFNQDRKVVDKRSATYDDLPSLKKKVLNWDEKQFSKAATLSGYDIYYYTITAIEALLEAE